MPTFTVSRAEVYDYLRCPKIVAIKAYRSLHAPEEEEEVIPRAQPKVSASIIGKIGEVAVAAAFSPAAVAAKTITELKETVTQQARMSVADLGVVIDENAQRILDETVKGLADIRSLITEEFGDVQVIGRGGCRNGPFPGEALPDFVAVTRKHEQPILIEVKNTPKPVKTDYFQASFYNTVARETGVVVHEQRFEDGKLNLVPIAYHQSIADTLLVYPRGSAYEKVTDQVSLTENAIKEVWLAKQLGFLGRSPHTDCGSKCPHHRLGIELLEGNLEVAKPLPLIFAQGLTETGDDLGVHYLQRYFNKSGMGSDILLWTFRAERDPMLKAKLIGQISARMGIPESVVETMAFGRIKTHDPQKVLKEMSAEVEPWERILGKERMDGIGPTLQSLATRLYSLPDKSEEFVKRSLKKWN